MHAERVYIWEFTMDGSNPFTVMSGVIAHHVYVMMVMNHVEEDVVMESIPAWCISCVALSMMPSGEMALLDNSMGNHMFGPRVFCQLCHFWSHYPILSSSFSIHSMIGKLAQKKFCHVYDENEDLNKGKTLHCHNGLLCIHEVWISFTSNVLKILSYQAWLPAI